ncbi:hypothetical protein BHE74_00059339 [Ensete ventricosum]|nr:hypothetical protein BHE74_00059339 [Ensete ventricosum]
MLDSFRPLPWEPERWPPGRFGLRSLMVFVLLYHQSLGVTYWLAICSIFGTVVGGCSVSTKRVIEKARHIMASHMSYKAICAMNAATCSIGSEPPSYASNIGSQKCYGMGLS